MIHIRTEKEIELLRKSSKILAEVKQVVWDFIKPGVNLLEIDALAEKEIKKRGAKSNFKHYQGFPNASCISVNEVLIHGIPSDYIVKEGDIVSIDLGCTWKGYHSDSAFTKGVGKISPSSQKVIDVAKDAFYAGLNAIKRGARIGDIENAIGKYIKSQGMYTPDNFTGHGIGTELHAAPYVRNSGAAKTGPLLKNGMVICIEPMILQKSKNVKILEDGWTVVAEDGKYAGHYEHTVLIENGEAVILSEGI